MALRVYYFFVFFLLILSFPSIHIIYAIERLFVWMATVTATILFSSEWQNLSQNLNLVCICYLKCSNRIFCAIDFSVNIILSIAVHSIRFNILLIWRQQHLFLSGTNRFLRPLCNILETTSHLQYKFLTNVLSTNRDAGKFISTQKTQILRKTRMA